MTEIVYPGPLSAVALPDGTVCKKNEPVEVRKDYVEGLVNQGWTFPTPVVDKKKDAK